MQGILGLSDPPEVDVHHDAPEDLEELRDEHDRNSSCDEEE